MNGQPFRRANVSVISDSDETRMWCTTVFIDFNDVYSLRRDAIKVYQFVLSSVFGCAPAARRSRSHSIKTDFHQMTDGPNGIATRMVKFANENIFVLRAQLIEK